MENEVKDYSQDPKYRPFKGKMLFITLNEEEAEAFNYVVNREGVDETSFARSAIMIVVHQFLEQYRQQEEEARKREEEKQKQKEAKHEKKAKKPKKKGH